MNTIIPFSKSNPPSFESLLAPHMEALYKQAYCYTGNTTDAEDLLQELLLFLYKRHEKLQELDPLRPWLMRCLYHRFVDNYRRKPQEIYNSDYIYNEETHHNVSPSQAKTLNNQQETQYFQSQIKKALKMLSYEQRAVITLCDIEGRSLLEVAEITEIPVGTLKSHLHRGRKQLKKLLDVQPFSENLRSKV